METHIHTEETHKLKLNSLCRICGERSKKFRCDKKPLSVNPFAEYLKLSHELDISTDKELQHSKTICRNCYMRLSKLKKNNSSSAKSTADDDICKSSPVWTQFDANLSTMECGVCSHYDSHAKAGRPKKQKAPLSTGESDFHKKRILDQSAQSDDFDFAVPGPSTSTPKRSHRYTLSSFQSDEREENTSQSPVTKAYVDCATSPFRSKSLRLLPSVTLPLTEEEEVYNTHLNKLKMDSSFDKQTVKCKTGGQPLYLKKIVKPRKSSVVSSQDERGLY